MRPCVAACRGAIRAGRQNRHGIYRRAGSTAALLDKVERGEQIVITRHGKLIARLVPEGGHDVAKAMAAVEGLLAIVKQSRHGACG
jgi:hypothetical protein